MGKKRHNGDYFAHYGPWFIVAITPFPVRVCGMVLDGCLGVDAFV